MPPSHLSTLIDVIQFVSPQDLPDHVAKRYFFDNLKGEDHAVVLLNGLENALRAGAPMFGALKDASEKATVAAMEFAKEHPILARSMLQLVALGILVILAPWAVQALGFGVLGPIEGSFAASWQASYGGLVPAGSWFSFFQRIGMVWSL